MPIGGEISVIVQEGLITCYNSVIYEFNPVIVQEGLLYCYIK